MPDLSYREFYIKKKNGKKRRICAPSKDLLKAQRNLLPFFSTWFRDVEYSIFREEIFHGFVPNRNYVTAATKHLGFAHTISLDISNCFDSISPINIPSYYTALKQKVNENLAIITHEDGSLAQGFATSPILANIYLLEPVKELHDVLKSLYPEFSLTIYADDIQISIPPSSYTDMNSIVDLATVLFKAYGLTINKAKTRIHHAKYGNRRILGVQVGDTSISPNRRLKKKIRAARFQKNGPSLGGLVTASRLLLPKDRR